MGAYPFLRMHLQRVQRKCESENYLSAPVLNKIIPLKFQSTHLSHVALRFQILTIKRLEESDNGEYRCAISNEAGPGESLSGYNLKVWGETFYYCWFC